MKAEGTNQHLDPLDELLRRYLLEEKPPGLDGEDLLTSAEPFVLQEIPLVTPSAAKEAEMISRLQKAYTPNSQQPGPRKWAPGLKLGFFSAIAIVGIFIAILFIFRPFDSQPSKPEPSDKLYQPENPIYSSNPDTPDLQDDPSTDLADAGTVLAQPVEDDQHNLHVNRARPDKPSKVQEMFRPRKRSTTPNVSKDKAEEPVPLVRSTPAVDSSKLQKEDNVLANEVPPFPLKGLFAETVTPSRYMQLETERDTLIQGPKGTLLHIPSGSFVTQEGQAVKGRVQLELKEIYKRSDYLLSNLPTESNGQQLVSGGVIYLDATAAGRRLKLAENKKIYVEFPTQGQASTQGMELYHGAYDNKGQLNWVPEGGKQNRMIPLSLDKLYFDDFYCSQHCDKEWNNTLLLLRDKKYQDTWLMTLEFRERLASLVKFDRLTNVLKTYLKNVSKPLWEVDQMVAERMLEDFRNFESPNFAELKERTFLSFARQGLTYAEDCNSHGVNMSRADAKDELLMKGVSSADVDRLMRVYRLRSLYEQDLEAVRTNGKSSRRLGSRTAGNLKGGISGPKFDVSSGSDKKGMNMMVKAIRGFFVGNLGWTNLEKLLERPGFDASKSRPKSKYTLKVKLEGELPDFPVRTFVVYSGLRSMKAGEVTGKSTVKFKKLLRGGYWLVSLGFQENVPYVGFEKIDLKGNLTKTIKLKRTNVDEFMALARKLDQ